MKIAVAGTGYVGLSIATLLAQHNEVIAVDVVLEKVEQINRKESRFNEPTFYSLKIGELIAIFEFSNRTLIIYHRSFGSGLCLYRYLTLFRFKFVIFLIMVPLVDIICISEILIVVSLANIKKLSSLVSAFTELPIKESFIVKYMVKLLDSVEYVCPKASTTVTSVISSQAVQ